MPQVLVAFVGITTAIVFGSLRLAGLFRVSGVEESAGLDASFHAAGGYLEAAGRGLGGQFLPGLDTNPEPAEPGSMQAAVEANNPWKGVAELDGSGFQAQPSQPAARSPRLATPQPC